MSPAYIRSIRLNLLLKLYLNHHDTTKLKNRITQMHVSSTTAKSYYDTVIKQSNKMKRNNTNSNE